MRWYYLILSIIPLVIYWLTAYRTITWWDNSSYPIAANCLGVESPPGSLLLTLIGWFVLKLSFFTSKIFILNLFAGVMAVCSLLLIFKSIKYIRDNIEKDSRSWFLIFSISGLFIFAFSHTFWTYAVQFTPYMLTVCMTALLLFLMMKLWFEKERAESLKLIFVICLMFGLDFSIHRTNALLIPGFVLLLLFKDIKLFIKFRVYLYSAVGLILGLSFHLLRIPMAMADPIINFNNPDNLSRFYEYVSLKQYGGGFLTNVFTRKADIISVQTFDYLKTFYNDFIPFDSWLGFVSVLILVIAIYGLIALFRKDKKFALMLLLFYILTTALTIFYFNIPENYFRSLSRHYLPSFVIMMIFVGYGFGAIVDLVKQSKKSVKIVIAFCLFILPLNLLLHNYQKVDGSSDYTAQDYGLNVLNSVEENAIVYIMGDIYYPIFYFQQVEGMRPDVDIISLPLTNTNWYNKQLMSSHYNLPQIYTDAEIDSLNPIPWADSTIMVAYKGDKEFYGNDSVALKVSPTINGKYIMNQDRFALKLIEVNGWERPIYFSEPLAWLKDYSRSEGLLFRIMPDTMPETDYDLLKKNLMDRYIYYGYEQGEHPLEMSAIWIRMNLWQNFAQILMYYHQKGEVETVLEIKEFVNKNLPFPEESDSEQIDQLRKLFE